MTKPHYLPKRYLTLALAVCLFSSVFSQNARKLFKAGQDFFQAGNYKDAIAQFTSSINLSPEFMEAYEFRGLSYQLLNDHQKAADDFNRAIVFDSENEILLTHLAKSYNELRKFEEALNLLNRAISLNRKFLPAYQEKIKSMLALDKAIEALKVSDSTLALQGNAMNYYLQGVVTERLNSFQKAEWAYSKSIKEDKRFIESYIALANLQISQDKPEEAMFNCNEALKIDPASRGALLVRSKAFVRQHDFQNAITDISKNIANDPQDQEMYLIRATCYQHFNQHQNAIHDFSKVLLLKSGNAAALYGRAKSYEAMHNFQAAVSDYEMLVTKAESDIEAKMLFKEAKARLFELKRESDPPEITLLDPLPGKGKVLEVPDNRTTLTLKGHITDKSAIRTLKINDREVKCELLDNKAEFSVEVPVKDSLNIIALDVYNNQALYTCPIERIETTPPVVIILAPKTSGSGEIYLEKNDSTLILEGKVTDEHIIKSILIDGVTASYTIDEINPSFSAVIDVINKNEITVLACDIYGNSLTVIYRLTRETAGFGNTKSD